MNKKNSNKNISSIEKVISIASYCSGGLIGCIWFIIGILMKQTLKPFLKYHIFQSIFLSILFFLAFYVLDFLFMLLSMIPFIGKIVGMIYFIFNTPIFFGASIINIITFFLLLYLSTGVLLEKYSYIPWVSNIIKSNIK